jgi:hypothetical protein
VLQRPLAVLAVAGEQKDLRVDPVERALELLVVSHLDHAVEPKLER